MTTKELIEQAKWEIEHIEEVVLMPTYRELIHKFEMAYKDISKGCKHCKYGRLPFVPPLCDECEQGSEWQWRGDVE